ncbi:MAG: hypothetical protein P8177_04620, partial [Gemmatimonadota bacterium]
MIAPASLRGQGRSLLRRAGAGWTLLSHTELSRGRVPHPSTSLVVVDEAHRFRNPRTLRYAALAGVAWAEPRPRVLLITATPVNNGTEDLLHLLRLFLRDDALAPAGVPSLLAAFDGDRAVGSPGIRAVIDEVVVRRTRGLIAERYGFCPARTGEDPGRPRFPRRAPPRLIAYADPALPELVSRIGELELSAYDAPSAGGGRVGGGTALLRLGLLKRLDSSPAAFHASLERLVQSLTVVRDAARAGRRLAPGAAA